MKIKIEVPLLEGQSLDAAKLNDALRAAGLAFNGFHHAQAAIVECAPADEQQVRQIIATHLQTDWKAVAAREVAKKAIDAKRDAALLDGVSWNGKLWHTDSTFQSQLTGYVAAFSAGILPNGATVKIRARDNSVSDLGLADLKALAAAVMTKVATVWATSWAEKDALP